MIRIQHLTRRYGSFTAVHDVSTHIERGSIVGLLGHNGAGKTTMMKMLTGYLEPSEGSIHIDEIDVTRERERVQRRIGYLPENAPSWPELLVQDYLATVAQLRGVPDERIVSAVVDAAERTGLVDRLTVPIRTLSKGYRQRVGLAQAIVHNPDVLILDEPTNGLDPAQIRSIRSLIRSLGERTTILLSTHILQEVEAVCDRVLLLMGGELVADAPLKTLLGSGTLRVEFADAGPPEASLVEAPGVEHVQRLPSDDDRAIWRLVAADGGSPDPTDVATYAVRRGWALRSIGPERRTLDQVFREMESAHVAAQVEGAA
jgi:ABC-2 type transport system ATP-binding protein